MAKMVQSGLLAQNGPNRAQNGRRGWGGGQGLRRLSPRAQPAHYPRWLRGTAKPFWVIFGPFWPFGAILGILAPKKIFFWGKKIAKKKITPKKTFPKKKEFWEKKIWKKKLGEKKLGIFFIFFFLNADSE